MAVDVHDRAVLVTRVSRPCTMNELRSARVVEELDQPMSRPPSPRVGVRPTSSPEPLTNRARRYAAGIARLPDVVRENGQLPSHQPHRKLQKSDLPARPVDHG